MTNITGFLLHVGDICEHASEKQKVQFLHLHDFKTNVTDADLGEKEVDDLVFGEDGMGHNTQQEILKADSPSLHKVWVKVVC